MNSAIYHGQVMHKRLWPVVYRFQYQVMSLRIDIDELDSQLDGFKWLSLNRFNLYSLYLKDYGSRNGKSWRGWVNNLLQQYGLPQAPARVELVCFPRFLGFTFNPMAVWYAYDQQDNLIAVIAEVSNTFKQWHHYVLTDGGNALNDKLSAQADKVFHVSPFIGMNCRYDFRFAKPGQYLQIGISQTENEETVLKAVQSGKALELNNKNLLLSAIKQPFSTLKVVLLIHWWALKIWLKGGKFHKTPQHLAKVNYGHTEMKLC